MPPPPPIEDLIALRFGQTSTAIPESRFDDRFPRQLLNRGSVRDFTDQHLPAGLLDLLLAAALSSSSKSDLQQVAVIRVASAALRALIAEELAQMPWLAKAPEFLLFCGDTRRLARLAQAHGEPPRHARLEDLFNATVDAALVLQSFTLVAESQGLGTCPISGVRPRAAAIGAALKLPSGVFPVAGLALGYPARAAAITPRLPLALTVHQDSYDDAHLEQHIDAYNARRAAPAPASEARLPWSHFKVRQSAEQDGQAFARFLADAGFHLG